MNTRTTQTQDHQYPRLMKIEQNKYYCTRDGQRLRVICTDRNSEWPVVALSKGGGIYFYSFNGQQPLSQPNGNPQNDLVAEWVDRPVIDRASLPAWANKAVAMDKNGLWYYYSAIPRKCMEEGVWLSPEANRPIPDSHAPKWTGDWTDSLVVFDDEKGNK